MGVFVSYKLFLNSSTNYNDTLMGFRQHECPLIKLIHFFLHYPPCLKTKINYIYSSFTQFHFNTQLLIYLANQNTAKINIFCNSCSTIHVWNKFKLHKLWDAITIQSRSSPYWKILPRYCFHLWILTLWLPTSSWWETVQWRFQLDLPP